MAEPLTFARLRRNAKRERGDLPKVRLAVLGDSPTQLLCQALEGYGVEVGLDFELFESDYDQIDRQLRDPTSELHAFAPEVVLVWESTDKLHAHFARLDDAARAHFAEQRAARIAELVRVATSNASSTKAARFVWCTFPETGEDVFGSFAGKTRASFTYQLRALNLRLMDLAAATKTLFLCDLAAIASELGRTTLRSARTYVNTGIALDVEAFVPFAKRATDVVRALRGAVKKCLVLDLDNTMWGGVLGEDGLGGIQVGDLGVGRAHTELQLWAKLLRDRGVLLAVCSKNDEDLAREPFEKHPEMVLRSTDFAAFVANWENKVDNLRHIQKTLEIGFDAMVFVDDSPFERGMVRAAIPEITVPELPEDPADYVGFLQSQNLFETASFSEADRERTRQYQEEAARTAVARTFANEAEYLASLEMRATMKRFDALDTPRVAQLTQRSNQWNLRTIRYTEDDIARIAQDPSAIGLSFRLTDRFGDYGLVSVVVLRELGAPRDAAWFIDTWLMSCRVLKRGMERFVLDRIVDSVRERGARRLVGEYIRTKKNGLVERHFEELGFSPLGPAEGALRFELHLGSYEPRPSPIVQTPEGPAR